MKTSHSIVFFVIILVAVAGVFLFLEHQSKQVPNIVQYQVACATEKIDQSIYELDGNTSLIGAFIRFSEIPLSEESKTKLTDLNIKLDEQTWIFDYVVAQIPTNKLCDLADLDFVSRIFLPETAANLNNISKL